MIPRSCVVIETEKFPALPGEDEEIVNPGTYGRALCEYLEKKLPQFGIEVPFFCCEDWGWWLEVVVENFKMGLCIYSNPEDQIQPRKYAILPSIKSEKEWSWRKFRWIDRSQDVLNIMNYLDQIFQRDPEIRALSRHDDYPF